MANELHYTDNNAQGWINECVNAAISTGEYSDERINEAVQNAEHCIASDLSPTAGRWVEFFIASLEC